MRVWAGEARPTEGHTSGRECCVCTSSVPSDTHCHRPVHDRLTILPPVPSVLLHTSRRVPRLLPVGHGVQHQAGRHPLRHRCVRVRVLRVAACVCIWLRNTAGLQLCRSGGVQPGSLPHVPFCPTSHTATQMTTQQHTNKQWVRTTWCASSSYMSRPSRAAPLSSCWSGTQARSKRYGLRPEGALACVPAWV